MTQDRNELALTEFEIDPLERVNLGIGDRIVFFDVSQLQHGQSSSAVIDGLASAHPGLFQLYYIV